jgi:hypothetical protein
MNKCQLDAIVHEFYQSFSTPDIDNDQLDREILLGNLIDDHIGTDYFNELCIHCLTVRNYRRTQ